MKTILWLGLVLVALAGCGSTHGQGGSASPSARLSGHVYSAPSCPVQAAESPCPPRPLANAEIGFQPSGGGTTEKVRTNSAGAYAVELPAGHYEVRLDRPRPLAKAPHLISVAAGERRTLNLTFDSGIR